MSSDHDLQDCVSFYYWFLVSVHVCYNKLLSQNTSEQQTSTSTSDLCAGK